MKWTGGVLTPYLAKSACQQEHINYTRAVENALYNFSKLVGVLFVPLNQKSNLNVKLVSIHAVLPYQAWARRPVTIIIIRCMRLYYRNTTIL